MPSEAQAEIRSAMRAVAERLALPFKMGLRRTDGPVPGTGTGSSIDFQDHRPYVPGDDPRHIDWHAYARSGHYSMKLYREEVRPHADLVVDGSHSMFVDAEKGRCTLELAWFCLESALRAGASVRLFSIAGSAVSTYEPEFGWQLPTALPAPGNSTFLPDIRYIPWRAASLRVFISDLLYPAEPNSLLLPLLGNHGRPIVLAPYSKAEASPDWLGNRELVDCETADRRDLRFSMNDLHAYSASYLAHFELWRLDARRHGIPLARVAGGPPLAQALSEEAIAAAAVELI